MHLYKMTSFYNALFFVLLFKPESFQHFFNTLLILSPEEPQDIVAVGIYQQHQQEDESYCCGSFEEFVAWFAACHHFPQQEKHVTAVESRYREDVHHRQDD